MEHVEERTPSAQLSASVIYFFVSHIGKGPIIRGDLGLGFFKSRFYPDTNKYPGSGLSFGPLCCMVSDTACQ